MANRVTHATVTFTRPFRLAGMDDDQTPGLYDIETTEERIDGVSMLAYRRVSTTMVANTANTAARVRQVNLIEPDDLTAALARDKEI